MQNTRGGWGEREREREREGAVFSPPLPLLQIASVCFIFASSQLFESLAQAILPDGIVYHVTISKS